MKFQNLPSQFRFAGRKKKPEFGAYGSATKTWHTVKSVYMEMLSIAIYPVKWNWVVEKAYEYTTTNRPELTIHFMNGEYSAITANGRPSVNDLGNHIAGKIKFIEGEELVRSFFPSYGEDDTGKLLYRYSDQYRTNRILESHKKTTDRIDAYMEDVPELPKDIRTWIENVALQKSRYIFYKRQTKKLITGFCTVCGKDVKVKAAAHNTPGTCPSCRKKIVFKAEGKSKHVFDRAGFTIMNQTKHGLVMRYFSVGKDYCEMAGGYRKPETRFREVIRYFWDTEKKFEWGNFKQLMFRWTDDQGFQCEERSYLYTANLKKVLKDTEYKYSAIEIYAKKHSEPFYPKSYLKTYKRFKALEYIVKRGLYRLTDGLLDGYSWPIDAQGRNIKQIMGMPKEKIDQAVRVNANIQTYREIKNGWEAGISYTDAEIRNVIVQLGCLPSDLKNLRCHASVEKILKYLKRQFKAYEKKAKADQNAYEKGKRITLRDCFAFYSDYLKMAENVNYDLKNSLVLFPKQLVTAHDEIVKLQIMKKNEANDKKIAKIAAKLRGMYAFENKQFLIRIPESASEIVEEGQKQHHCVGSAGYIEKMIKGTTAILFLRKKEDPDKPFYTVELDPQTNKILQCRGLRNATKTKEVEQFINQYEKKVLNKPEKQNRSRIKQQVAIAV